MQSAPTMKAAIMEMIAMIEHKKRSLDELLDSLKDTIRKLDRLPPEAEMFLQPGASTRDRPPPASSEASTSTIGRLATDNSDEMAMAQRQLAGHRSKQFKKLAMFFVDRKNRPATVRELTAAIGASRSATSNILYRTQKEAFVSYRVEGERRLRSWSLKPELYQRLITGGA